MKVAVELDRRLQAGVFVARCPAHEERTGSVRVRVPEKDWRCLSCGAVGAVAYVQRDDYGHPVRAILEGVEP